MNAFWTGFEKRAGVLQAGQAFAKRMMPKAQAAWQKSKPVMQSAATKGKALAAKGKAEVMKTPQRALAAGLVGGAAGMHALSQPSENPAQYAAYGTYY